MAMTVSIAILAKAPIPGFAKTRLIPAIGAHAAATVQERLTEQTVATACAAGLGKVTLWCAPDPTHASFRGLAARFPVVLAQQPSGDLGVRMLATFANGPTLATGTDCPPLTVAHLQRAAATLAQADIVVIPAEDGGYVLIGAQAAHASLLTALRGEQTGCWRRRERAPRAPASALPHSTHSGTSIARKIPSARSEEHTSELQ